MPELPEVETIRRQLGQEIVGKKLDGQKIVGVRRRAKILIIDFSDGSSLIFHLKLTGQLIFNGERSSYTRRIFKFDDGSQMVFNDMRKFGWWKEVKKTKSIEENFGPEALDINLKNFKILLRKRPNAKIKPLLMDQKFIAGIGNIYSDEILFASGVQPIRQVKTLSEKEVERIWRNTKKILQEAIKYHGTSERSYVDAYGRKGNYLSHLKAYQREGKKCLRCRTTIKRIKLGSRSAHFCPKCQR